MIIHVKNKNTLIIGILNLNVVLAKKALIPIKKKEIIPLLEDYLIYKKYTLDKTE